MNDQGEQKLGLWDCISIIVGIVIGTTIFYLPWLVFMNVPNPWMGLTVWVFGGLLALMGGLCYAELATTYPRSGGDYNYLTRAFGPGTGFLFGWAQLIIIMPASIGIMAFVFAEIAAGLHRGEQPAPIALETDLGFTLEFLYAVAAVVVLTLLNVLGVTMGKITQNILTVLKIVGLIAILVAGFVWGGDRPTDWTFPRSSAGWGWEPLAIILVLYAYGGWNDAAFVAAEVRDRRRNIPIALLLGIGAITVIYVLINLAYIYGLGWEVARQYPRNTSLPAMLMVKAFDENGGLLINLIIMASALGAVNGLIFTGSRIYATLGQDHRLFGFLGHWRPGSRAPIVAVLLQSAIAVGLIFLLGTQAGHDAVNEALTVVRDGINAGLAKISEDLYFNLDFAREWRPYGAFDTLLSHSAPAFWVFFLLAGFSLFKLRSLDPMRERPFKVPAYPFVPFVFCCMCLYMVYRSTIYIEERVLFVIALLLVGIPLYGLSRLLGGPRPQGID